MSIIKFSERELPTDPGLWWFQAVVDKEPEPVRVFDRDYQSYFFYTIGDMCSNAVQDTEPGQWHGELEYPE